MSFKAKVIPLINEINIGDTITVNGNCGVILEIHYGKYGPRIKIQIKNKEVEWYFLSELDLNSIEMYDATAHCMHALGYRD